MIEMILKDIIATTKPRMAQINPDLALDNSPGLPPEPTILKPETIIMITDAIAITDRSTLMAFVISSERLVAFTGLSIFGMSSSAANANFCDGNIATEKIEANNSEPKKKALKIEIVFCIILFIGLMVNCSSLCC